MIHFYPLNPRMCQLGVRNVGIKRFGGGSNSSEVAIAGVNGEETDAIVTRDDK